MSTVRTNIESTSPFAGTAALQAGMGIAFMIIVGLLHLVEAPDNYSEAAYKGILFALNGVAAMIAAYGIYHHQAWGWWLGLLVAGGALIMYIISRTIGLPVIGIDDAWFEPIGLLSLLVEAGFVIMFGLYMRRRA